MARKKVDEDVVEEKEVIVEKEVADEVTETTEKKYTLNKANFTAIGEHWLSLCNPSVTLKSTDTALIESAEEQVKLGILKVVK